jgi:hypothetical protein
MITILFPLHVVCVCVYKSYSWEHNTSTRLLIIYSLLCHVTCEWEWEREREWECGTKFKDKVWKINKMGPSTASFTFLSETSFTCTTKCMSKTLLLRSLHNTPWNPSSSTVARVVLLGNCATGWLSVVAGTGTHQLDCIFRFLCPIFNYGMSPSWLRTVGGQTLVQLPLTTLY